MLRYKFKPRPRDTWFIRYLFVPFMNTLPIRYWQGFFYRGNWAGRLQQKLFRRGMYFILAAEEARFIRKETRPSNTVIRMVYYITMPYGS